MSTKGLPRVSSDRAHGRADQAGPSLAQDVEEASAGNGRAQSSIITFMKERKYVSMDETKKKVCPPTLGLRGGGGGE